MWYALWSEPLPTPCRCLLPIGSGSGFHVTDCLDCNSEGGIKQVISMLSTAQELWDCKQRSGKRFFTQFPLVLHSFRSIPLAFHHSSKPLFPCVPHRTVAENVVKNAPRPLPDTVSRLELGAFFMSLTACMVTLSAGFKKSFPHCLRLRYCGAVNNTDPAALRFIKRLQSHFRCNLYPSTRSYNAINMMNPLSSPLSCTRGNRSLSPLGRRTAPRCGLCRPRYILLANSVAKAGREDTSTSSL